MQVSTALRGKVAIGNATRKVACKPVAPVRSQRLVTRVAAVEDQQTSSSEDQPVPAKRPELQPISDAEFQELELAELDAAQEQVLSWMLFTDEEQQEEDLDEMVDYDEFGDEEYEELFEEVEELIEASAANTEHLKVGDKVIGSVYEIDEDGAYVELGDKASGFVPLSECSFAKLKTVGHGACGLHVPMHVALTHVPCPCSPWRCCAWACSVSSSSWRRRMSMVRLCCPWPRWR